MGIESSKNLAKTLVFWPNINHDIANIVNNCETCIRHRQSNTKEPLIPHEIVDIPWFKVGIDIFEFNKCAHIIVVDYYSKYIEIAQLISGYSSKLVTTHLKSIFARHGIPVIMVSDNGPPFNSEDFKTFCTEWGIEHVTSSPYLARSNGMAERSIRTVKNLLIKCHETNTDPYSALLLYRTTPKGNFYSPSELLMSRKLRTKIPTIQENLKPSLIDNVKYKEQFHLQRYKTEKYYNRNTKSLKPIEDGKNIYYQKTPLSDWLPGTVVKKFDEPRSYLISDKNGTLYRRNRQHILIVPKNNDEHCEDSSNNNSNSNSIYSNPSISTDIQDKQPQKEKNSNKNNNNNNECYITQYGRKVIPPSKYIS